MCPWCLCGDTGKRGPYGRSSSGGGRRKARGNSRGSHGDPPAMPQNAMGRWPRRGNDKPCAYNPSVSAVSTQQGDWIAAICVVESRPALSCSFQDGVSGRFGWTRPGAAASFHEVIVFLVGSTVKIDPDTFSGCFQNFLRRGMHQQQPESLARISQLFSL